METRNLFVKFVKFNEHTLHNLINDEVHFSSVDQLNDFCEKRYLAPPISILKEKRHNEWNNLINSSLKNPQQCVQILDGLKNNPYLQRNFYRELKERILKQESINDTDMQPLLEQIAYCNVGIFSISSIDIFENVYSNLMFAHYGDANKGLALIYEIPSAPKKVTYVSTEALNSSRGSSDRIFDWCNGIYNDVNDFSLKLNIWEYEQERRLFNRIGTHSNTQLGIKLKVIFHTPIFTTKNLTTLEKINHSVYADSIRIQEISPPNDKTKPVGIYSENDREIKNINKWLSEL